MRRTLLSALLVVLVAPAASPGQTASPPPASLNPDRSLTQYLRTVWQRAEGLPQNTVMDVLHTRDGYLWAATQGGLVRFDGVRFTVFSTRTNPALRTDDFTSLLEDREGTLWIGTAGGGLFSYRDGTAGGVHRWRTAERRHQRPLRRAGRSDLDRDVRRVVTVDA